MVVLRMDELVLTSNDLLPKRRIFVKLKLLESNNLLSMFLTMLRRISLSFWNRGHWRKKCTHDSKSVPHLQIGFKESWKLCLNLCSGKWLRPVRSLVISFIPLELRQLKKLFKVGLMDCKIFFKKIWKLFLFQRLGSSLFLSIALEGKNVFFKKLCFILNKGTLPTFLVLKAKFCCGTILEDH